MTPNHSPVALTVGDACEYLGGLSRATLYRLVAADRLRTFKVGARTLILRADLDRFVEDAVGGSGDRR